MKIQLGAILLAGVATLAGALPAAAATYINDGAEMFSATTVSALESRIDSFHAQTGKEIVVVTVPSLNGATIQNAADQAFAQRSVNGVLIYIAKSEHRDIFVPGKNEVASGAITASTLDPIRSSMESQFKAQEYDGGITNAVDSLLSIYHSHLGSLNQQTAPVTRGVSRSYAPATGGGFHLSMFWIIVLIVVGFLVLRSIFRAMSGPRYYGGGPMPGGPGYYGGGPGFGGGYYGGGGGGFWSGLLGGLGGAWLGNEMFGGNRGGYVDPGTSMVDPNTGATGAAPDAGMWGNDAGQAGAGSAGDWGSGGFGDSGGGVGGGFDGGGGGDSGGGW